MQVRWIYLTGVFFLFFLIICKFKREINKEIKVKKVNYIHKYPCSFLSFGGIWIGTVLIFLSSDPRPITSHVIHKIKKFCFTGLLSVVSALSLYFI